MAPKNTMQPMDWYVYCLKSTGGQTYVGATVEPERRLRQHNCELKGGARATARGVARGDEWSFFCYVGPFEKHDALRFEWRWKWLSRKRTGPPLERRQAALNELLEAWEDKSLSVLFP